VFYYPVKFRTQHGGNWRARELDNEVFEFLELERKIHNALSQHESEFLSMGILPSRSLFSWLISYIPALAHRDSDFTAKALCIGNNSSIKSSAQFLHELRSVDR